MFLYFRRQVSWVVLILHFLLFCKAAYALNPNKEITQYSREVWRKEAGLPSGSILSIMQSRQGYLWFGTFNGLVRFDGVAFKVYDRSNTPELLNNGIRKVMEAKDGTLWIATNGGGLASYKDGRWHSYNMSDGLPSDIVLAVHEASSGLIYVATRKGVRYFDPAAETVRFLPVAASDGNPLDSVTAIVPALGSLLICSYDKIYRLDPSTPATATLFSKFDKQVRTVLYDSAGALWIATRGGGIHYWKGSDKRHFDTSNGLSSNVITSLYEDRDKNIWIGTGSGGLIRYNQRGFAVFTEAEGLTENAIESIYEDREGSLWVGTYRNGINRFRDTKFLTWSMSEGLADNVVFQAYADKDGSIWICTTAGLSYLKDGKITNYTLPGNDKLLRAVVRDQLGRLWMGGRAGLFRMEERGAQPHFELFNKSNGLPSDYVRALIVDQRGTLWIGTNEGLARYDEKEGFKTFTREDGLSYNTILSLYEDRSGTLWIGTDGGGLTSYRDGQFKAYTSRDGLAGDVVFCVYEDSRSNLWIATNNGLTRLRNGVFKKVGSRDGLASDNAFHLLEDNFGYLWIGYNNGIFKVSLDDLTRVLDVEQERLNCVSFGREDGMKSDECTPSSFASKTPDGKLYFPTLQGIVVVDPAFIPVNKLPPSVVIENLVLNGRYVLATDGMVFQGTQNYFEIHYNALSLLVPSRVKIKYRLSGVDKEWVDAGNRRVAYYTTLPPGEYDFHVIASNNDGVWNEEGAHFRFTIRPPFWMTWWAQAIYVMLILSVIYAGVRIRTELLEARNRALKLKIEERTRELAESNRLLEQQRNELQEANLKLQALDRVKADFAAMLVHDLKSPLTVVRATLGLLESGGFSKEEQARFVATSQRNLDKMLTLINDTLEIYRTDNQEVALNSVEIDSERLVRESAEAARISAASQEIELEVSLEPGLPKIKGDPDKLERVFSNLLSNAIKFTPAGGRITVRARRVLKEDRPYLEVTVRDTGEGIPEESLPHLFEPYTQARSKHSKAGVGLGLAIVKRIITAHGGQIGVSSRVGEGTAFTFTLPAELDTSQTACEPVKVGQDGHMPHVLVVEDDKVNLMVVEAYLKRKGYTYEVAYDGEQALEALAKRSYDLVLMDCRMPKMDGFEAASRIRAGDEKLRSIPIIALTASSQDEAQACLNAGMNDFLEKPFKPAAFEEKITKWLSRKSE